MTKAIKNTETLPIKTLETKVEPIKTRTYAELLETYKTKSGVIRGLNVEGMDTKTIYKTLTDLKVMNTAGTHAIRYQHVRNVLQTPVKKAS